MKRKERMLRMRERLKRMDRDKDIKLDVLIANCMMTYGISRRDAKEELMAIMLLEGLHTK